MDVKKILTAHTAWLRGDPDGICADLRDAVLSGADLRRADLRDAIGDGEIIRTMQLPRYVVVVCDDWVQIGCQGYRAHEWRGFDDDTITSMDVGALEWWRQWKDVVLAFVDCA